MAAILFIRPSVPKSGHYNQYGKYLREKALFFVVMAEMTHQVIVLNTVFMS